MDKLVRLLHMLIFFKIAKLSTLLQKSHLQCKKGELTLSLSLSLSRVIDLERTVKLQNQLKLSTKIY